MYVAKWKEDDDYFTGSRVRCWSIKEKAKLFASKKEVRKAVLDIDSFWEDRFIILYMHPLNLNPKSV